MNGQRTEAHCTFCKSAIFLLLTAAYSTFHARHLDGSVVSGLHLSQHQLDHCRCMREEGALVTCTVVQREHIFDADAALPSFLRVNDSS